jgi:hypothetical protein
LPLNYTPNYRKTMKKIGWILWLVGLAACRNETLITAVYRVPEDVDPYVQAFAEEARQRGIQLDVLQNLVVTFEPISDTRVCGLCRNTASRQKYVILSTTAYCWQEASPEAREALVFHELGHCFLARQHTTKRFASGYYASLMNPNDVDVYNRCIYPISGNNTCDKRNRRAYYINELFDEKTPEPSWAK